MSDLITDAEELRAEFERRASDPSFNSKRSRKGNYVNPAVARDWKWFLIGHEVARMDHGISAAAQRGA